MAQLPVILTAFANSYDADHLAYLEQEQDRVQQILAPLSYLRHVPLPNAKTEQLVYTLTEYHKKLLILHFGGHADSEHLYFKDSGVHVAGLAENLSLHPQLKLVFLNGCNTQAQAKQYVNFRVPAVIATTCSVADGQAMQFAKVFYTALAKGHTLEEAFSRAKGSMKLKDGVTYEDEILNWRGVRLREEQFVEMPWRLYVAGGEVLEWKLKEGKNKWDFLNFLQKINLQKYSTNFSEKLDIQEINTLFLRLYKERYNQKLKNGSPFPISLKYDSHGTSKEYAKRYFPEEANSGKSTNLDLFKILAQHDHVLILGDPGVGKTTLLLKLAIQILEINQFAQTPVIYDLSSWNDTYGSFDYWLEEVLVDFYDIPKSLAKQVINKENFVPLFDGFDEVGNNSKTRDQRALLRKKCLQSIRKWQSRKKIKKMVICSKKNEYAQTKDDMPVNVQYCLEPLNVESTIQNLDNHFKENKINSVFLGNIRDEIYHNSYFKQVLTSQFFFKLAELTLDEKKVYEKFPTKKQLIENELLRLFIDEMLIHSKRELSISTEKVKKYLSILAQMLTESNRKEFDLISIKEIYQSKGVNSSFYAFIPITLINAFVHTSFLDNLIGFSNSLFTSQISAFILAFIVRRQVEKEEKAIFILKKPYELLRSRLPLHLMISFLFGMLFYSLIYLFFVQKLVLYEIIGFSFAAAISGSFSSDFILHFTAVRLPLVLKGQIPFRFVRFLNFLTKYHLLEQVGGKWNFHHQKLQHFLTEIKNE